MLKIENVNVSGFDAAIRGMRNPLNSWDKSDSYWTHVEDTETLNEAPYQYFVGDEDEKLMKRLADAGPVHGKFMRMINVTLDVTAPLYWWKEFDTYKVGTVANSCSTMHTIANKEFSIDDFSCEHLIDELDDDESDACGETVTDYYGDILNIYSRELLHLAISLLNAYREKYLATKDKKYWWQLIQLLPSSYDQRRTVMLNYEVLKNIYNSRKDHKLDEWHTVCSWIESLPHSDLITGGAE